MFDGIFSEIVLHTLLVFINGLHPMGNAAAGFTVCCSIVTETKISIFGDKLPVSTEEFIFLPSLLKRVSQNL
jgi:hypothetical protein